jgi:hypothetical protein
MWTIVSINKMFLIIPADDCGVAFVEVNLGSVSERPVTLNHDPLHIHPRTDPDERPIWLDESFV